MRNGIGIAILLLANLPDVGHAAMSLVPYAGHMNDNAVTLIYDPTAGHMAVETNGSLIATFELVSESGILTGTTPSIVFPCPFECHVPRKLFFLRTAGVGDTDLGPVERRFAPFNLRAAEELKRPYNFRRQWQQRDRSS